MAQLKHPISGATYTLIEDGLVEVDNNGLKGLFDAEGRHLSGKLTRADPHMLVWLAGPQLPADDPMAQKGQRNWAEED